MIFVNFKTYEQGTGVNAIGLVRILDRIAYDTKVKIIPVIQASDIKEVSAISKLEIWAQNIDPVEPGAHTGATLAEAVKEDGAVGTFLNHSEHKFGEFKILRKAVDRARAVELKTLVFAGDLTELKKVVDLSPTYVSYEPPELVGSKTSSVAKAKPDIIKKAVEIANSVGLPLVVGAGIKSQEDVKTSLSLGAVGVAVASDVVTDKDPEKELLDLTEGFR